MKLAGGWWIPTDTEERHHPVRRRQKKAAVIDRALDYHTGRRIAIQAGAHLGLWPIRLAAHFSHVWAFEAVEQNWQCAEANVRDRAIDNVDLVHAALGASCGRVEMVYTARSTGTHCVVPEGSAGDQRTTMLSIDSLSLDSVDAIFLDIEGTELHALEGGIETIERDRPVIVCEENRCNARYGIRPGDLARWLSPFGYNAVANYSHDIIFAC